MDSTTAILMWITDKDPTCLMDLVKIGSDVKAIEAKQGTMSSKGIEHYAKQYMSIAQNAGFSVGSKQIIDWSFDYTADEKHNVCSSVSSAEPTDWCEDENAMMLMGIRGDNERIIFDDDFSLQLNGDIAYSLAERRITGNVEEIGCIVFLSGGKPETYSPYGFPVPRSRVEVGLTMKRQAALEIGIDAFPGTAESFKDSVMGQKADEKIVLLQNKTILLMRSSTTIPPVEPTDRTIVSHLYSMLTPKGMYFLNLNEQKGENHSQRFDEILKTAKWEADNIEKEVENRKYINLPELSFNTGKTISADGITIGIPDGNYIATGAYDINAKLICIMDQINGETSFLRLKDCATTAFSMQKPVEHGRTLINMESEDSKNGILAFVCGQMGISLREIKTIATDKNRIVFHIEKAFETDKANHLTVICLVGTSKKLYAGKIMMDGYFTREQGLKEVEKWEKTISFSPDKTAVIPKIVLFGEEPGQVISQINLSPSNSKAALPQKSEEQIIEEKKLAAKREKKRKALENATINIRVATSSLEKLNQKLAAANRVIDEEHEFLDIKKKTREEAKKQEHECNSTIETCNREISELSKEKEKAQSELSSLGVFAMARKKELKQRISDLDWKINHAQEKINEAKAKKSKITIEFYKKIRDLNLGHPRLTDVSEWETYAEELKIAIKEAENAIEYNTAQSEAISSEEWDGEIVQEWHPDNVLRREPDATRRQYKSSHTLSDEGKVILPEVLTVLHNATKPMLATDIAKGTPKLREMDDFLEVNWVVEALEYANVVEKIVLQRMKHYQLVAVVNKNWTRKLKKLIS